MKVLFADFLFSKHMLVNSTGQKETSFETLFSLANLFNIRIVSGQDLVEPEMIRTAERCIGCHVPDPFYKGFPQSVKALSSDALLFDQLLHYFQTYVSGDFSEAGTSMLEETFERLAFREKTEIRDFSVVTEEEAVYQLAASVNDLLASTRPLSELQYALVLEYIREYHYEVSHCASKDTAVQLLLDTRDAVYAAFLQLSDVIRVLDHLNYNTYGNKKLNKLNLKNQDRKFLTQIINTIFQEGQCNIVDCFEKKKIWNGLLHHIHYQPINETAKLFVDGIRGDENLSVYSSFEKHMHQGEIREAVLALRKGKGSGALLRNLTYILSRCETEDDVSFVLRNLKTDNPLILIQLLLDYSAEKPANLPRTFKFTKHNLLRIHRETDEEYFRRRSVVTDDVRQMMVSVLRENLQKLYRGRLGKVYIAPNMEKMAVPLQETTASGGFGVLPKGSRIPIEAGKKIRCFTYWRDVEDIDLSVIGLTKDNRQIEFSWRSMWNQQSDEIAFSGDQTSGYNGGSEYYDVDLDAFTEKYPEAEYLVFCNNVYSEVPFNRCLCKAGYMNRDVLDSGAVFEPRTVATSFQITCNSIDAYLFAIDLNTKEMVWLNVGFDGDEPVAGDTALDFLKDYLHASQALSLRDLFTMLATEVVEKPEAADVIVSDEDLSVAEAVEIIHSYDTERILALMNAQ